MRRKVFMTDMRNKIWDLPIRVFHWSLAGGVLVAYFSGKASGLWLYWHVRVGELILGLIVFRVMWGFVGTTHARFVNFLPTMNRIHAYQSSKGMLPGHSPQAGVAVLVLLGILTTQTITGLFTRNDEIDFNGPLYVLVSEHWSVMLGQWHRLLYWLILVMLVLHVTALMYYRIVRKKKLLLSMITGDAYLPGQQAVPDIAGGGWRYFVLSVMIALIVIWLIEGDVLLRVFL